MITIETNQWTRAARILKDGADAGMIENGKAYAQGMTAPELRELADRMEEEEAGKSPIENPDAKAARDCAQCVIDIAEMYAKGVYSESAFLSAMARHGDRLRMIAEGST